MSSTRPLQDNRTQVDTMTIRARISPSLWFDFNAKEAVDFYVSVFPNSKVMRTSHYLKDSPGPEGEIEGVAREVIDLPAHRHTHDLGGEAAEETGNPIMTKAGIAKSACARRNKSRHKSEPQKMACF